MTHTEYLALRRFPALDGLRAVAAAMVIFFHYGGPTWDRLFGWIGVHVFFVLSGFLITTLALREESRTGNMSLWRFYVRRAARILPVYYVVLVMVGALYWLRGEYRSSGLAHAMPYYASFLGDLLGPDAPHTQVWTLGIEQKFYLLWPLLAFPVALVASVRAAVASLVALTAITLWYFTGTGMFIHYAPIAMGCLLAVVAHSGRGWTLIAPLAGRVPATLIAVGFVVLQLRLPELKAVLGGTEPPLIVVYAAAVVVLLISILGGRGPLAWLLSRRPLIAAGDRSYSLYLIQGLAGIMVVGMVPALATHRTLTAVVVLATGIILADLLYRWVEVPFIGFGRRWTRPPAANTVAVPPIQRPVPQGL